MTGDEDAVYARLLRASDRKGVNRLVDHVRFAAAAAREFLLRQRMQDDNSISESKRRLGCRCVAIAIEVGARDCQNDRAIGV